MDLHDIVKRQPHPIPWHEGDNIPWHDPDFSERMLQEHLTQEHDMASRRLPVVQRHVAWIHDALLHGQQSRILDLCCGPGLYAQRLTEMGHVVTGVDYSPASIRYAREQAAKHQTAITYVLEDVRKANFGERHRMAMLIFGEFNVFRPADIRLILRKTWQSLEPGGLLLLEPHTYAAVHGLGSQGLSWCTNNEGLFSDRPHIELREDAWDPRTHTATIRYYIVDGLTAKVRQYAQTMQAYSVDEYISLLDDCGFDETSVYPSLADWKSDGDSALMAIVARKT